MQVGGVVGVVGAVVVEGAEQDAVLEVGESAAAPGPLRWWASHQSAGMSQPSARQVPSRTAIARRWASLKSRRARPRCSGWALPPSTTGTMPAVQARRSASVAESRPPPSRPAPMLGGAHLAAQLVERDGDDHGGGGAAVAGEDRGRERLEQGAEGAAEPHLARRVGRSVAGSAWAASAWSRRGLAKASR